MITKGVKFIKLGHLVINNYFIEPVQGVLRQPDELRGDLSSNPSLSGQLHYPGQELQGDLSYLPDPLTGTLRDTEYLEGQL